MPHVYCLRSPGLVWLHAISDGSIALAYFLIPLGLLRLVRRRRDLALHWLLTLFAVFILSCGATHVLAIVTLWVPIYRFDALIKVVTAVSSLVTAAFLIHLLPKISTLPSPEQWRLSNEELKAEIAQRRGAEDAMMKLNADLERRVEQRTQELAEQNVTLQELKAAWDQAHGLIREENGIIRFWCEGSEELYGWKKQEAVGRNAHQLLATEFPKPLPEIENELKEKNTWSGELTHTTRSGSRLHVATHWVRRPNSRDQSLSVIEVNNDITDRLRAEDAMQMLADIVESSGDAIIGTTLDGLVTSWNRSAENLFGYSTTEMLGHSIDRLMPVHQHSDGDHMHRLTPAEGASRYETICLTSSGREVSVSVTLSPIRNLHGVVIGTSQIINDISDAKAREEAFRLSEERQRLAVDAGQVGLWYLDVESGQTIWTTRCKELHGLTADSPAPDYAKISSLVHADDREAVLNAIQQSVNTAVDLAVEYRTRGLDFRTKWIQARGRPKLAANGKVIGIHGAVIDLTDRRQVEDKLRRLNMELEQFAYAAAHDLQEPLRNVALAASLLKAEPADNLTVPGDEEDQRQLLAMVIQNARRMESMVKDLLAYSRSLDVGELQDVSTDANLVVEKALRNLSAAVAEKSAVVTRDHLPIVSMHSGHLLQILQNLIGNAIKYAGDVVPRIHVGARARNEDVLVFVKDNGVGIPEQFHQKAFRMFTRLHTGEVKGSGVGLAVSKRIVEHYGGQIWIESEAGKGATFLFTIPTTLNLA